MVNDYFGFCFFNGFNIYVFVHKNYIKKKNRTTKGKKNKKNYLIFSYGTVLKKQ